MPQIPTPSAPRPPGPGGGGPPMGSTPAVSPTPNRGGEASALQAAAAAAQILTQALNAAGATSEIGGKILDILKSLNKLAPPGSASPAGQKNVMDQAQLRHAQQNQQAQQLRAQMMKQAGGGAGGDPP